MIGETAIDASDLDFNLLALLGSHRDVVTKAYMVQSVWGNSGVTEKELRAYINRLRDAVGEHVDRLKFVKTVNGVGYSLGCDVDPIGTVEQLQAELLTAVLIREEDRRQRGSDEQWDRVCLPMLDQVRSALEWALDERFPARRYLAMALAGASYRLWERGNDMAFGRAYVERAVSMIDRHTNRSDAARLYWAAGMLYSETRRAKALEWFEKSASLYRRIGDNKKLGLLLSEIGSACVNLGKHEMAHASLQEAEKLLSITDQSKALWKVINDYAMYLSTCGSTSESMIRHKAALDLAKELNDPLRVNIVLLNMAEAEFISGAPDRAVERLKEAERGMRSAIAPATYRARPSVNLATYLVLRGDFVSAEQHALRAISIVAKDGGYWLWLCLQSWAAIAADRRQYVDAARILGFVDSALDASREVRQRPERQLRDRLIDLLQTQLSTDDIHEWSAEGAAWTEERVVSYVRERVPSQKTEDHRD